MTSFIRLLLRDEFYPKLDEETGRRSAHTIINIHRIHLPSSDNTKDTNWRYFTPLQLRYAADSVVHYCSAFYNSIWKIKNENKLAFEDLINSSEFQIDMDLKIGIDGFDIQEIQRDSVDDVMNVISYSSKFLRFNEEDLDVEEDFRIYPMPVRG